LGGPAARSTTGGGEVLIGRLDNMRPVGVHFRMG
jgi:hypothetical protein